MLHQLCLSKGLRVNKLTKGTLVRLSRKGKDCPDLRAIPRDDIGLIIGTRVDNVHGIVYKVKWMRGYYPHHDCYRSELKFASNKQRQLNQKRLKNVT